MIHNYLNGCYFLYSHSIFRCFKYLYILRLNFAVKTGWKTRIFKCVVRYVYICILYIFLIKFWNESVKNFCKSYLRWRILSKRKTNINNLNCSPIVSMLLNSLKTELIEITQYRFVIIKFFTWGLDKLFFCMADDWKFTWMNFPFSI